MIDVARSFVETRLHEDDTKTSVAAPEAAFALEFDHNGDSPRVLWRSALTSRETGLRFLGTVEIPRGSAFTFLYVNPPSARPIVNLGAHLLRALPLYRPRASLGGLFQALPSVRLSARLQL